MRERLVGYTRVSTTEQGESGAGLDAQLRAIEEEAHRRGSRVLAIYQDVASGRSTSGRPGLDGALADLRARRADGLVVSKLDRLSRSLLDFALLMERSRREDWRLIALDLGIDTTRPEGELMASVLSSFAQFERRLIGQRTKDGLAEKRAQGVILGRPRDLATATAERIIDLHEMGVSLHGIARTLASEAIPTARGGRWTAATVRAVLSSRGRLRPAPPQVSLRALRASVR